MTCTSGGDMKLTYSRSDSRRAGGGSAPSLRLDFKKANKGSNQARPAPGHCAWTHRKLNGRENSPARLTGSVVGSTSVVITKNGTTVRLPNSHENKLINYVKRAGQRFSMVVAFKKGKLVIERVH